MPKTQSNQSSNYLAHNKLFTFKHNQPSLITLIRSIRFPSSLWIRSLSTTIEPLIWESNSLLRVIWVRSNWRLCRGALIAYRFSLSLGYFFKPLSDIKIFLSFQVHAHQYQKQQGNTTAILIISCNGCGWAVRTLLRRKVRDMWWYLWFSSFRALVHGGWADCNPGSSLIWSNSPVLNETSSSWVLVSNKKSKTSSCLYLIALDRICLRERMTLVVFSKMWRHHDKKKQRIFFLFFFHFTSFHNNQKIYGVYGL